MPGINLLVQRNCNGPTMAVCMVLFPFLKKCCLRDGGANLYSGAKEFNKFQHSRYVSDSTRYR